MPNGLTESTTTETVQLTLTDENISQADYERLRAGEKVEVEKSAPAKAKPEPSETVDESETSEPDDEGSEEESEADESLEMRPKKKSGSQRRIEKLVKQRTQAEQEREYWREQALKAQGKPAAEEPKVEAKATTESEPDPDNFESATDFYRAHAKWVAKEELKAAKESERQEKMRLEAEAEQKAFVGKVDEFRKTHGDFDEVVTDVDDILMPLAIQDAIKKSANGPELMYELARNREEYARICALSPLEAVRALGRFEARLEKPDEEKKITKPKTTKAPPPPRPVSASSNSGKKSVYDEDISQAEYERIRAEQEKRRNAY